MYKIVGCVCNRHVTWVSVSVVGYSQELTVLLILIPLTNYIEAAVEFADSISSPTLAHFADLRPLVEVWVEALHTGQRRHAVVASHRVHETLAKEMWIKAVKSRVDIVYQSQLQSSAVLPPVLQIPLLLWGCSSEPQRSSSRFRCRSAPRRWSRSCHPDLR